MSDTTEMMMDGTLCQCCGVYIDEQGYGVPRSCEDCEREAQKTKKKGN